MSRGKRVPIWAIVLILLFLTNLGWISVRSYRMSRIGVPGPEKFEIELLHTNVVSPWPYLAGDPSAIGVVDVKSGRPAWAKWTREYGEDADLEYYYFRGQHVFDVYWTNGHTPIYDVYFRGPGKAVTWWRNRGGANTFTERTSYDTNGNLSEDQVWYSNTWYVVSLQYGANGIIINGKWRQLAFDTNGMWTIESDTDTP